MARSVSLAVGVAMLVVGPAVPSPGIAASAVSERAEEEIGRRVERGEVVETSRPVPEFPWPEFTVTRRVASSPLALMAVYADFDRQADYMPGMVTSRIVRRLAPNAFEVFYEYEVAGPNERYTVEVVVERDGPGLRARWRMLSARYARRLAGEMAVRALGSDAVVVYTTRVDPGTLGVAFGTPDGVARRLRATLDALGARVEQLASREPATLAALVERLNSMLGGR